MKKFLLMVLLIIANYCVKAQNYLWSKGCHYNVNDPSTSGTSRKECIDATFKYAFIMNNGGDNHCTGTLINRNTDDGSLGFYFLTARHCFYNGSGTEPDWDHGQEVDFYFNYQSKDASSGSGVKSSNVGNTKNGQSNLYDDAPPTYRLDNNDDYQYHHRSRLRVVSSFYWGDFMLCEILTPIPPHFNITYAGWNPNPFRIGGGLYWGDYAGIHHPRGDVKKISQTNSILWLQNPVATGCYTVTKVIDALFGWIWGRKWSTAVICNYIDNPKFAVPTWAKGGTEGGSSGSGMFTWAQNRTIGVLSFGFLACSDVFNQDFYGKLSANYSNKKVKTTMNPKNSFQVDNFGMPKRKITCYPYLDLPGAPGVSGEYFPAKDYQADNAITLQSEGDLITSQPINIYDQADYRFRAANTITLNPGFDARPGSTFVAEIGGCQTGVNQKTTESNDEIIAALREIRVPKQKDFDMSKYAEGSILSANNLYAQIYPNPNNGNFGVKLSKPGDYEIKITDLLGKTIYNSRIVNTTDFKIQLSSGYQRGNYFVHISSATEQFTGKMVITE